MLINSRIHSQSGVDIPTLVITLTFFLLGLIGLGIPAHYISDEGFYIPTAVRISRGIDVMNREHPMFAKEMLAVWFQAWGVSSVTWRLLPLLCGSISIYAASAAMPDRISGRILGALLALGGLLFVLSRVGLLEAFYLMFCALGAWAFVARRYAPSGILFGLAIACKWTAAPLLACFCFIYAVRHPERLARGALLLSALPVAVYLLTFVPAFFVRSNPIGFGNLIPLQHAMLARHSFVDPPHPYASQAWQWVLGQGSFWLEHGENGILLAGNPAIMFCLPLAVVWGLWKRWPEAYIYCALILFWAITAKTNQFYYHYLLPSAFAMATLARILALCRWAKISLLSAGGIAFAFLYPAMTGHPWAVHRAIWPDKPGQIRSLTPDERTDFERREYCMYHPSTCYPVLAY